jgi:ribulose-bisphosphate carboxylase large chain
MQAIDAWQEGVTLEEKAKKAQELREALEKWGHYKPK